MIFNKLSQDRRNWGFGVTVLFILGIAVAPREPHCARCGTNIQQRWSLPMWAYSSASSSSCWGWNRHSFSSHASPILAGLSWGNEAKPASLISSLPQQRTDEIGSKFQRAEQLALSQADFSHAVDSKPVAEPCGLPEITAAPSRAVVLLFPVSSGR